MLLAERPAPRNETRRQLQELIRRLERRRPPAPAPARAATPAAEPLPGLTRRETDEGPCTYRELRLPATTEIGRQPLASLFALPDGVLPFLAPGEDLEDAAVPDLLFLDIETTGLGGAGAMAFLVATGRVEGDAFVLRQYLALAPEEEASVLAALAADVRAEDDPVLVTYNGRGFDAPMLDGRMTMHRRRGRFEALRHLDLLGVARTLYRGLLDSCRLGVVEAELLGMSRPGGEIPGSEVPTWYFRYLHTRDMRYLAPIVRHNELDVVALGGLLARLGELADGASAPAHGGEALAFGRLLARRGRSDDAIARIEHALAVLAPSAARDDGLLRLAALHKRAGRRDRAESLWAELAARPGPARLHAQTELAKYYEHERRDYAAALTVVEAALAVLGAARPVAGDERRRDALTYRSERVRRKLERAAARNAAAATR